ncbi:MAG: Trk system potassium transporter TrkA [Flavobacteriaceae bacterium]
MKIIIAGAGDVGFHLAKLLSFQSQDIYIIDQDAERLEYINAHLDVITKAGDATSIELLKEVEIAKADMLLAVTESQNTNLTISAVAKKLGVQKTIARISNTEYLKTKEIDFTELGVDFMISPELLASQEILSLIKNSAFNDTIAFENGTLNVLGCTLHTHSPLVGLTVEQAKKKYSNIDFIIMAVKREDEITTIIPRGDTVFEAHDQVYFCAPRNSIYALEGLIGRSQIGIKDIMILGGSRIGQKAATALCQENRNVKLIESNRDKAFNLAENLCEALVIHGDGRNVDLLNEEDLATMDAFVAVTGDSETNIMSCLVAKTKGVKKTIALVENMDYIDISQTIGIDTLINKKLLAASAIFKHIRKGKVLALANLHNIEAEVLEFYVGENSPVTKHQIKDLKLTSKAIFGGVIRDGVALMTYGTFLIEPGDKVVMFCLPEAISEVEKLFN